MKIMKDMKWGHAESRSLKTFMLFMSFMVKKWKLEPQQRGAPHFHLLVWGIAFLHHQRLARRWFEIVGSNDPRHLAAGTRVEAVRSRNGVMRYASKLYMGKEKCLPAGSTSGVVSCVSRFFQP